MGNTNFPADFFLPPQVRPQEWIYDPKLRMTVDWLKTFIPPKDWNQRREAIAKRLYFVAMHGISDPLDRGRFFDESDLFGWYLFTAEASLDHVWNYDPNFGSRVVPVFKAIGRNLPLLRKAPGIQHRIQRLVGADKSQPNGALFELLVAGAYLQGGAAVEFVPEQPGKKRTHDLNVCRGSETWAVECKRMELGEYGEDERTQMRALWDAGANILVDQELSTFCDITFRQEIRLAPENYLTKKILEFLQSVSSISWSEDVSSGCISALKLDSLQQLLKTDSVLSSGSKLYELLTGEYVQNASYLSVMRVKPAENPRYIDECNLAVLCRWDSRSPGSINAKARDVLNNLAKATDQLPNGVPGIVHIGFESVYGPQVELARNTKIADTIGGFDPRGKRLEHVYVHRFAPESPPHEPWAFEETRLYWGKTPGSGPLNDVNLVLPPEIQL